MLLFDLASIICIGISHIYLFQLFLGHTNISWRFVIVIGTLLTAFISILLAQTGFVELNVILLFGFLLILGLLQKKHQFHEIVYCSLISIVLFTVVKNGLLIITYKLYMESPFNYYIWTNSALHMFILLLLLVGMFLARNVIKLAGTYLLQSKVYVPSYVILVICTVLLLIVNFPKVGLLAKLNESYGEQLYMIVLLIGLVLLSVISIMTYISKERLIEQHEQSKQEQLVAYVEKLEFLHDELATFRHDYANLLLSLEGAIRANNLQQVKQIFEQTIAPTATLINHHQLELTKLSRITVPEVKSVLSMKILAAQRKSLTVHLDIPQPISQIAMPMDEFIRIMSILLDNAVEGAEKSDNKMIQIALFVVGNLQYFVVKNSIGNAEANVEKLYAKSFSTKGEGRGIGLFSVQRIIEKNPNATLLTKVEDMLFTQELMIKTVHEEITTV